MDEVTRRLRERTGLEVVGCYAFGHGPAQADELLAFVTRGTKRATTGALVELAALDDPVPAPGQLWGLLDGAGQPRYVAETTHVVTGRLGDVTPSFAWDEGEDDRTLESWRAGHRPWAEQLGVGDPDGLEVLFERFRIVWPEPDRIDWSPSGVRELRFDEHAWVRDLHLAVHGAAEVEAHDERWDVAVLPALVCELRGWRVGAVTFRPRPGGDALVFGLEVSDGVPEDATEVAAALRAAIEEVGHRHGWDRIVWP